MNPDTILAGIAPHPGGAIVGLSPADAAELVKAGFVKSAGSGLYHMTAAGHRRRAELDLGRGSIHAVPGTALTNGGSRVRVR